GARERSGAARGAGCGSPGAGRSQPRREAENAGRRGALAAAGRSARRRAPVPVSALTLLPRVILDLVASAYGGVADWRRQWYAHHPERRRRLQRPVVSIGNLRVGGTG